MGKNGIILILLTVVWIVAVYLLKKEKGNEIMRFLDILVPTSMGICGCAVLGTVTYWLSAWEKHWSKGRTFLIVLGCLVSLVFLILITWNMVSAVSASALGSLFPGNVTVLFRMVLSPGRFILWTLVTIVWYSLLKLNGFWIPLIFGKSLTGFPAVLITALSMIAASALLWPILRDMQKKTLYWLKVYGRKRDLGSTNMPVLVITRIFVIAVSLTLCMVCNRLIF